MKLCCYPGTGQKGIGPDSILVMSPKGNSESSWWLFFIWPRPASHTYLCPFISGHWKYTSYWVSHWSQKDRSEGPGSSLWAPCELLCRKLICRTGFNCSSQRKPVWLDIWIPETWSTFSWNYCIDPCSSSASWNKLSPKLIEPKFPQEAWWWAVQISHLPECCQPFSHAFVALSSPAYRHSLSQSCGSLLTLFCSLVMYNGIG